MRSGDKIDGKMHLLMDEMPTPDNINVTIAFPYTGNPANRSGQSLRASHHTHGGGQSS